MPLGDGRPRRGFARRLGMSGTHTEHPYEQDQQQQNDREQRTAVTPRPRRSQEPHVGPIRGAFERLDVEQFLDGGVDLFQLLLVSAFDAARTYIVRRLWCQVFRHASTVEGRALKWT